MGDILDSMIYAVIACNHDDCTDCELKDERGICLLNHCPEGYDLDKIREALTKPLNNNAPDEYQ